MNLFLPFALILVVVFFVSLIKIKSSREKEFDERELQIRGNAYRYAYSALILFHAFYVILLLVVGRPMMADGVGSLLSIFLSIAVFAVYCIRHDAFKTMRTERGFRAYAFLLAVVVAINGWSGILAIRRGEVISDGLLQVPVSSICCAVTFLVVLIAMLIRRMQQKTEDDA